MNKASEDYINDKIRNNPVFEQVPHDNLFLAELCGKFSVKKFKSGSVIAEEGRSSSALYILVSGEAEIIKKTPAGDTYNTGLFTEKDNFSFGEFSLIRDDFNEFTVRSETDTEWAVLPGEKFRAYSDLNPEAGFPVVFRVAEMLSDEVNKVRRDMMTLYEALVHEIKS